MICLSAKCRNVTSHRCGEREDEHPVLVKSPDEFSHENASSAMSRRRKANRTCCWATTGPAMCGSCGNAVEQWLCVGPR